MKKSTMATTAPLADTCLAKILGSPRREVDWRAAIVIQGPYEPKYTKIVIDQMLYRNRNVLLILATYANSDEFLSEPECALITAGILVVLIVKPPSQTENPDFWSTNKTNRNLQRLSSFVGVRYALSQGIEYTLKIRSDTFLGMHSVIDYFRYQVQRQYPPLPEPQVAPLIKGRIVVLGQGTITNPMTWVPDPFHVRDHFYFGYTQDLLRLFSIVEGQTSWRNGLGFSSPNHNAESSITQLWMKDLGIRVRTPAELVARYMITQDLAVIEVVRLAPRLPGWSLDYARYLREGSSYLKELHSTMDTPCCITSHRDWFALYRHQLTLPL